MKEQLRTLLRADPRASEAAGRIDWGVRVQGAPIPAVTLLRVGAPIDVSANLRQSRIQIDVWANDYAQSDRIAKAINSILSGFRGVIDGVDFTGAFLDEERDLPEADTTGVMHRVMLDYRVWTKENI